MNLANRFRAASRLLQVCAPSVRHTATITGRDANSRPVPLIAAARGDAMPHFGRRERLTGCSTGLLQIESP